MGASLPPTLIRTAARAHRTAAVTPARRPQGISAPKPNSYPPTRRPYDSATIKGHIPADGRAEKASHGGVRHGNDVQRRWEIEGLPVIFSAHRGHERIPRDTKKRLDGSPRTRRRRWRISPVAARVLPLSPLAKQFPRHGASVEVTGRRLQILYPERPSPGRG
jgi:hypothetical protein